MQGNSYVVVKVLKKEWLKTLYGQMWSLIAIDWVMVQCTGAKVWR